MKKGICVIGLAPTFTKKIAKLLADKFDMYFADVNDLIEFDIINVCEIEDLMGKEYLSKIENKKVKEVCSYENSLITLNFNLLNDQYNLNMIRNNCLLIYIKLNNEDYKKKLKAEKYGKLGTILNENLFKSRDFICTNIADLSLICDNLTPSKIISALKQEILEYYKKVGVL